MKRILKLDRLRLRGLSGARDEVVLVATAQNLRKLAKYLERPPPRVPALGGLYDKGEGVTQDYAEAVKWFHLAAEQGDYIAQYSSASCTVRAKVSRRIIPRRQSGIALLQSMAMPTLSKAWAICTPPA